MSRACFHGRHGRRGIRSRRGQAFVREFEPHVRQPDRQADGSSALTIGRRLPTEWETKVGTDVSLAPASSPVPSENLLHGTAPGQSSGSLWGNITMPGIRPLGFDKTAVEARIDGGKEEGKLGATLSRSVPLSRDLSVTWQNSYSVTQPLT